MHPRSRIWYRRIARILPRSFRDAAGAGLEDTAIACLERERARRGRLGLAFAWAGIVGDAITTAVQLRMQKGSNATFDRRGRVETLRDNMRNDLIYALRSLRATPGFTTLAIVVLTLGIGAGTTVFSVVDAVALRGVPFSEASRLVAVSETTADGRAIPVAAPNFLTWRAEQDVFEDVAAVVGFGSFTVRDAGSAEALNTTQTTASLFSILRVTPQLGRAFVANEELEGNSHVVILSDAIWRRRFGSDPNVVGKTISFDTGPRQIVGVMPAGFTYPVGVLKPADIWVPYVVPSTERAHGNGRSNYLQVVGRLKPGMTIERAEAGMATIHARLKAAFPDWFKNRGAFSVVNLQESIVGSVRPWMLLLLGAVACVSLIACANVASLMLARATARSREVRIRAALGATRWQIARSLMTESLVLSAIGACGGVLLAWWSIDLLRSAIPATLPRISALVIDLRVLGATAFATVATGVICGLAPAIQFSRPDVASALRDGGRSSTSGAGRQRLRTVLLVAEVALAAVLLVGAGLFVSSFVRLMNVDLGLDHRNVLTVPVQLQFDRSDRAARAQVRARAAIILPEMLERIRQIPGVEVAAALANGLPLTGNSMLQSVKVPGRDQEFENDDAADVRFATPEYFRAVRIPLRRGRYFNGTDSKGSEQVVVLNETAAKRYFPARDALGATLELNGSRVVVGIVGDVRLGGPETNLRPECYLPMAQSSVGGADLVVRTSGDPLSIVPAVKAAIWTVEPTMTIADPKSLESFFDRLIAERRFNMLLLTLFGVLAIVIAAAGIYGVMAYLVAQRSQEIGVRMALGAVPAGILRMVLGRAAVLMLSGLAIGCAAAWGLGRFAAAFLFRVEPHDPIVYAGVAMTLVAVGLVAAFVPPRRASRVDPLVALRMD